jgi:hypothetical protein
VGPAVFKTVWRGARRRAVGSTPMRSRHNPEERLTSNEPPVPATGSPGLLVLVRGTHSAIFLVELAAIAWLLLTGIAGRRDRSTVVAAVLVAGEAAVFLANDGVCPLTPLAERHGARRGGVSDIFLPDPVARTIPLWSTALIAVAAALHVRALVRRRR